MKKNNEQNYFNRCKADAELGNADAQFELGNLLEDDDEAFFWYQRAAEQGHIEAINLLGDASGSDRANINSVDLSYTEEFAFKDEKNWDIEFNHKNSSDLYEKAIAGDAEAQFNLAVFYEEGDDANLELALELYKKASEQNHTAAQNNLVRMYIKAAEKGDFHAQRKLGWKYYNGEGVVKDNKKAIKWYTKAAKQEIFGCDKVQHNLAVIYHLSEGEKDYKQAAKWYRKAAENNLADSQYNLGFMHYYGTGVLKDYKEALKWYSKAAEQGTTLAQFSLGNMYVKGEGVLKDYKKAAKWYKKAAEQGDIYAQYRLYIHANEMNIDTKKSLDWLHMSAGKDIFEFFELESDKKIIIKSYKEAVCRGYAESQYLLGTIYFENRKSAKDMSKSKYWINKAYENSDKDVAKKAADFWNKNELWINQDYKFKNTTEPSCEEKIRDIVKNVLTFEEKTERELSGSNDLDIGYRLREGSIILRDPIKAIKHFKKASKKGADKIKAAYELGVIYFEENSVQNYSESKKWIKKAYESTEIEISKKAEDYWNKHELWNY